MKKFGAAALLLCLFACGLARGQGEPGAGGPPAQDPSEPIYLQALNLATKTIGKAHAAGLECFDERSFCELAIGSCASAIDSQYTANNITFAQWQSYHQDLHDLTHPKQAQLVTEFDLIALDITFATAHKQAGVTFWGAWVASNYTLMDKFADCMTELGEAVNMGNQAKARYIANKAEWAALRASVVALMDEVFPY